MARRTLPGWSPEHVTSVVVHQVAQLPARLIHALSTRPIWEQPWFAVALLAGAVALVTLGWWIRHRSHRDRRVAARRIALSGIAVTSLLCALLGIGVAVNAHAGYAPTFPALWGDTPALSLRTVDAIQDRSPSSAATIGARSHGGLVVRFVLPAPSLHIGARPVYVYLPPGYYSSPQATTHYPVLYLMHGIPGHAADWLNAGRLRQTMNLLLAAHQVEPMIVVMPQVNTGFFDDSECLDLPGKELDESYLTGPLVQTVDSLFRTIPSRDGRAIGGMSAGGFCAVNLALRHLDEYSVMWASEPYTTPGRSLVNRVGGLQQWRDNSPLVYLPTMRFPEPIAAFLTAGSRDHGCVDAARWLATTLAQRGQYAALRIASGGEHTWTTARMALPYALVFTSDQLHDARSVV